MDDLLTLISRHGYLLLGAICLAEAIGLPLPAALAILTAGALTAYGQLHFHLVFLVGVAAMIVGRRLSLLHGQIQRMGVAGSALPPVR